MLHLLIVLKVVWITKMSIYENYKNIDLLSSNSFKVLWVGRLSLKRCAF